MPWKPGQSGNPDGRPRGWSEVAKLARKKTPQAIRALVYWARQKDPKVARAAVAAAEILLDRGWGKATLPVSVTQEISLEIASQMSREELLALQSLLQKIRTGPQPMVRVPEAPAEAPAATEPSGSPGPSGGGPH